MAARRRLALLLLRREPPKLLALPPLLPGGLSVPSHGGLNTPLLLPVLLLLLRDSGGTAFEPIDLLLSSRLDTVRADDDEELPNATPHSGEPQIPQLPALRSFTTSSSVRDPRSELVSDDCLLICCCCCCLNDSLSISGSFWGVAGSSHLAL